MYITQDQLNQATDELLEKAMKTAKKDKLNDDTNGGDEKIYPKDIAEHVDEEDDKKKNHTEPDGDEDSKGREPGDKNFGKSLSTDSKSGEALTEESLEKCDKTNKLSKGDDDDEDEEDYDDDDIEKSVKLDFMENPIIQGAAANNEVMVAVVEILSKSFADLAVDIKSYIDDRIDDIDDRFNESVDNDVMNKSMFANIKSSETIMNKVEVNNGLIKSMKTDIEAVMGAVNGLSETIESFSTTPNMRKSITSATQIQDRNFSKSIGTETTLSKSETVSALTNLFNSGNTAVTAQDIIGAESGAPIRPELLSLIKQ